MNILVVDDEAGSRKAVDVVLKLAGHHTLFARDGDEALKIFDASPEAFDLVITDHQMVHLSGLDLVRLLRERGFTGEIVVLTAYAGTIEEDEYKKLEVAGIMEKPFDIIELRQWLECINGCREQQLRTGELLHCPPGPIHFCWLRRK